MEAVSIERKENRFVRDLLGPEDSLLVSSMREFVDQEIMPIRREIEASTRGDFRLVDEMRAKLIPLGLQSGFLPEEYGGTGLSSALTISLLAEELGRGDAGLFYAAASTLHALRPAISSGNRAVLEHLSPRLLREDELFTGSFAVTEPASGCDTANIDMAGTGIHTSARSSGEGWIIDGVKKWPHNTGTADFYCVACNTDPSLADEGIALVYAEVPTGGLEVGEPEDISGLRSGRTGELRFDGARVPEEWRASGPGRDAELLRDNLAFARLNGAACAVGCAQGALEEVLAFTTDRIAAGKPIRQHTVAANILADIAISIQAGRDVYVNAAYMFDRPESYGQPHSIHMYSRASMAKVFCCEAAVSATNRVMELMGSYGYVSDYYVEKYWRDAKVIQLWDGGVQLGRLDVARGYYAYDQFHRNELYERISDMGGE